MSYPNSPLLLKGALIYFGAPMLIPIPNIIVFQYNPETMTRSLTPWQPPAREVTASYEGEGSARRVATSTAELSAQQRYALAQPYDPAETFSLTLELDATDALETPELHPIAVATGVADRLAAIEMLLYPPGDSLLGGLLGSVSGSVSFSAGGLSVGSSALVEQLERKDAPIVLFFWGPGRIVPVRITSLSIEEQQFSPLLYPTRAKATIGIRVLDLDDLVQVTGDPATGAAAELARACYKFTRGQKEVLATANLVNAVESIIGLLPI